MSSEMKAPFDAALANMLSNLTLASGHWKLGKNAAKVVAESNKLNKGELKFDYLGAQKAYCFAMTGWSSEFTDYIAQIQPPYRSNHPDGFDHHFFMSTLMEVRGEYSRSDGKMALPRDKQHVEEISQHIQICLQNAYLPWLSNFVHFAPELIKRVLERPDFYSYPAPLIAFILKKNGMRWDGLNLQAGKAVIKNRTFDFDVLQSA